MTDRSALLVTPEALARELEHQVMQSTKPGLNARSAPECPRTLVLDVRWSLGEPDGRPAFRAGHVPGAVYVDLDTELAGHGPATAGRHPLPGDARLTRAARRWGLCPGDRVVAYDGGGNLAAARAWWLLRDAGIDVRLLDGAWPAWVEAGLPIETSVAADAAADTAADNAGTARVNAVNANIAAVYDADATPASDITLGGGRMPRLTIAEAAACARDATLLDARAAERYAGDTEPIDPRAGHIPGARSAPTTENLDAGGRFLSALKLQEKFASVGVRFTGAGTADDRSQTANGERVGAYCGSGITASHTLFALELAGHRGALFPGSWSQWANHPELPVATGPQP